MKVNLAIAPFLAWFSIGILGRYVTLQIQPTVGFDMATNIAFFIFVLGGNAALRVKEKLHL